MAALIDRDDVPPMALTRTAVLVAVASALECCGAGCGGMNRSGVPGGSDAHSVALPYVAAKRAHDMRDLRSAATDGCGAVCGSGLSYLWSDGTSSPGN